VDIAILRRPILTGWPAVLVYVVVLIGAAVLMLSGPQPERDAVGGQCVGLPLMIKAGSAPASGTNGYSRSATYVCTPGYVASGKLYIVESNQHAVAEVREGSSWYPLVVAVVLLYPLLAWTYVYVRQRRAA
jgi:hypothetical protein